MLTLFTVHFIVGVILNIFKVHFPKHIVPISMRSEEIEISYDAHSTVLYGVFSLKLVLLRLYCVQVYSVSVRLRPKASERVL